jgi:hypothetical protein
MSAYTDINAALMTAWADHGLSYPTAYEGKDFTPPSDAPWCALFVMPASTSVAGLG